LNQKLDNLVPIFASVKCIKSPRALHLSCGIAVNLEGLAISMATEAILVAAFLKLFTHQNYQIVALTMSLTVEIQLSRKSKLLINDGEVRGTRQLSDPGHISQTQKCLAGRADRLRPRPPQI